MIGVRAGPLAAWASAWLVGQVASDEVLRAVTGSDAPHRVSGLTDEPAPLSELLIRWRQEGGPVRLVLPVPGDVRGVPGPAEFRAAAIELGEAVYGATLGAVPLVQDFAPSSAPVQVSWRCFAVAPVAPDLVSISDAQHELTTAVRECASELTRAEVSGGAEDIGDALRHARRAGERLNLPPAFPARAVALLAQAERLQAALQIALDDPVGGAIDRSGMAARAAALRPLATAVRRARLAGYNAGADRGTHG